LSRARCSARLDRNNDVFKGGRGNLFRPLFLIPSFLILEEIDRCRTRF
jgi:hypothetical protein